MHTRPRTPACARKRIAAPTHGPVHMRPCTSTCPRMRIPTPSRQSQHAQRRAPTGARVRFRCSRVRFLIPARAAPHARRWESQAPARASACARVRIDMRSVAYAQLHACIWRCPRADMRMRHVHMAVPVHDRGDTQRRAPRCARVHIDGSGAGCWIRTAAWEQPSLRAVRCLRFCRARARR